MPHAVSVPSSGLQALILCGPGSSFPTFTANPDENPKALLPIANRPMVWYPLEFCYRAGITNITLICPPSSSNAITSALNTHPALTSLPLPRPSLLAPKDLDYNTGTAEILRLAEVKAVVSSDFVVLPCDLVCELPGEKLIETWMITAASLPGILNDDRFVPLPRSGGLGVWYETKKLNPVKGEETDFIMTVPLTSTPPAVSKDTLLPRLKNLVYSTPTDSLKDLTAEKGGFPSRHRLLRKFQRTRMLTTYRDAHIYIFPRWVIDLIGHNPPMESIGEDVVGWWAKAGWQRGIFTKLGLDKILGAAEEPEYDVGVSDHVRPPLPEATISTSNYEGDNNHITGCELDSQANLVPPLLAYLHPPDATAPLIRRVDTSQLLLQVSLQLAKRAAVDENPLEELSPFAHAKKVAYPEGVKPRTTITQKDSLVAENVLVEEKTAIKESVVGANCEIREGAKLMHCLLMDGVVIGKNCKLTRCIIGRRAEIGDGSVLTDVEVQENLLVEPRTEDKNNRLMSSEGLEATDEDMQALNTAGGEVS